MKYEHSLRTNYFRVNDEDAFVAFMATVVVDRGTLELNVGVDRMGRTTYGFTCDSIIVGAPDYCESGTDEDVSYDSFILGLQEFLPDDEAIIMLEFSKSEDGVWAAGHTIVTAEDSEYTDLVDSASTAAEEMVARQRMMPTANC